MYTDAKTKTNNTGARTKLKDQQRLARKTREGKRIQGQEKTLTSGAAGWGAGTTLSLAFCALLSPAASAGAGGATTGGSTAAATAHPQEQQGLGPAWRTKNEENLRRWRSDDRARERKTPS